MVEGKILYWIFCGIGGMNCLFLGIYLLKLLKRNPENLLLSIFLVTSGFALLSKSFFHFSGSLQNVNEELIKYSLWYVSFTIKSICFYFYTLFIISRNHFKLYDIFHLSPYLIHLILFVFLNERISYYITPAFTILFFTYLGYLIITVTSKINKSSKSISSQKEKNLRWFRNVLIIYTLIKLIVMFFWFRYRIALDAIVITALSYFLLYLEFKHNYFSNPPHKIKKYKYVKFNLTEMNKYKGIITEFIKNKQVYLDRELTINKLAKLIKIQPYIISAIINQSFGINFNEFINKYRVEMAIEMLSCPNYSNLTIAYISYECGFCSLSSFNKFFKKKTNYTPGEYRRKMIECDCNV